MKDLPVRHVPALQGRVLHQDRRQAQVLSEHGAGGWAGGASAWGKVQCEDCLREWFDVYKLSGYEVTDLEDVAAN